MTFSNFPMNQLRRDILKRLAAMLPPDASAGEEPAEVQTPDEVFAKPMREGDARLFVREGNYDTPKKNNRSPYVATQELIDEIENGGVTLERLDELQQTLPVFKYKTQITIHGNFDKITNLRVGVGRYKSLMLNQNGTLGVRYVAIDAWKKQVVKYALEYDRIALSEKDNGEGVRPWRFLNDSTGVELRRTIGRADNKEDYLKLVAEGKELLSKVPQNLFVGSASAGVIWAYGVASVVITIDLQAVPEATLWQFIGYLTGRRITESAYYAKEQEKREKEQAEKEEYQRKWQLRKDEEKRVANIAQQQETAFSEKYRKLTFIPEKNKGTIVIAYTNEGNWYLLALMKVDSFWYWRSLDIKATDVSLDGFTPEQVANVKTPGRKFQMERMHIAEEKIKRWLNKGKLYIIDDSGYNRAAATVPPHRADKPQTAVPSEGKRGDAPQIVRYSDKSHAVIGNTYNYRDVIKQAGGTFNKFLKIDGKTVPGWVVPSSKIHLLDFSGLSDGNDGATLRTHILRTLARQLRTAQGHDGYAWSEYESDFPDVADAAEYAKLDSWARIPAINKHYRAVKPLENLALDPDNKDFQRLFSPFVSEDPSYRRIFLCGAYFEADTVTATNTHILLSLGRGKTAYKKNKVVAKLAKFTQSQMRQAENDQADRDKAATLKRMQLPVGGLLTDIKHSGETEIVNLFPPWRNVIPPDNDAVYRIPIRGLKLYCDTMLRTQLEKNYDAPPPRVHLTYRHHSKNERILTAFNAGYLAAVLDAMLMLGETHIHIGLSGSPRRAVSVWRGSDAATPPQPGRDFALIMPVYIENADVPLTPENWGGVPDKLTPRFDLRFALLNADEAGRNDINNRLICDDGAMWYDLNEPRSNIDTQFGLSAKTIAEMEKANRTFHGRYGMTIFPINGGKLTTHIGQKIPVQTNFEGVVAPFGKGLYPLLAEVPDGMSDGEKQRKPIFLTDKITFDDFFLRTFADFKKIYNRELPQRNPDFISDSGSEYWYDKKKGWVYRRSGHWFRGVASCKWFLDGGAHWGNAAGVVALKDMRRLMSVKFEAGEKYLVYSAARDKQGAELLTKRTGIYLKTTHDFYVFDFGKVGKYNSFVTAELQ